MATAVAHLPTPPTQFGLHYVPSNPWGNLYNAGVGAVLDCAEAAVINSIRCWTYAATGAEAPFVDQDALNLYETLTGYTPGYPATDLGTVLSVMLNAWQSTGVTDDASAVHQIISQVQLPTGDFDAVAQAAYLLGPVIVGVGLCSAWSNEFVYGDTWDAISPPPTIVGFHCFPVIGRSASGNLIAVTFGGLMQLTRAGFDQFTTGAFCFTTADYMNGSGLSPLGYTLAQLTQYQTALAA